VHKLLLLLNYVASSLLCTTQQEGFPPLSVLFSGFRVGLGCDGHPSAAGLFCRLIREKMVGPRKGDFHYF